MIARPEIRALAEQLAGILERARPMALMPNMVCVERLDVEGIVRRMTSEGELPGLGGLGGLGGFGADADAGVLRAARAVEKAVRRGYQVPFTDQVRLPRKRAIALAAALRAALAL